MALDRIFTSCSGVSVVGPADMPSVELYAAYRPKGAGFIMYDRYGHT